MTDGARQYSPACERNRDPILTQLRTYVAPGARVIEIASGTGMHAVHFAAELSGVTWQPTDPSEEAVASIRAWSSDCEAPGLLPPLRLDVCCEADWPIQLYDVLFCANMIHIAPWSACLALFAGAGRCVAQHGRVVLYGPFRRSGFIEPSNLAFDANLRERNSDWGVRERDDVAEVAARQGFVLRHDVEMPSNNRLLVFERSFLSGAQNRESLTETS
jgi:hypothetical protein